MRQKIIVLVSVIVLCTLSVSVVACKKSNGQSSASNKGAVITLLVNKDQNMTPIQAVIDSIEEKLGIRTLVDIHPGGIEGDNIIKTRLVTGDMVDIFLYNSGSLLHAINPAQNILDLTDEPFVAKLGDSFKAAVSVNGRVYGVPAYSAIAGGWLYNKKIYSELGLQVPHTWQQLISNLEKVQASGKIALIGTFKDTWSSQIIVLADQYNVKSVLPNYASDYTANKIKIANTPIALRSFEKLGETRRFYNRDFLATTYDQGLELLATGQGAHYPILGSLGNINQLYGDAVNDIGVFGQPGDNPDNHGITMWEPAGLFIYKNSPNIELAKQWLEYFISQEAIDIGIKVSGVKPDGPWPIKGIKLPADSYPGVLDIQTYLDAGRTAPALEFESPVKGPNLEQFCVEVGSGIRDARTAAAAYDLDVQKQAVQLNLPGW